MKKYETIDCRVLFVAEDQFALGTWRAFWRTASGAMYRVQSKALPERQTRGEAQADLDAYAAKYHYPEVDE